MILVRPIQFSLKLAESPDCTRPIGRTSADTGLTLHVGGNQLELNSNRSRCYRWAGLKELRDLRTKLCFTESHFPVSDRSSERERKIAVLVGNPLFELHPR